MKFIAEILRNYLKNTTKTLTDLKKVDGFTTNVSPIQKKSGFILKNGQNLMAIDGRNLSGINYLSKVKCLNKLKSNVQLPNLTILNELIPVRLQALPVVTCLQLTTKN